MKDFTAQELRADRPSLSAADCIGHVLKQLFKDQTHEISDLVCPHLTFEEVIGALLLAEDAVNELKAIQDYDEEEE